MSTFLILAGIGLSTWIIVRRINTYSRSQDFEAETLRDRVDVLESVMVHYLEHPYL